MGFQFEETEKAFDEVLNLEKEITKLTNDLSSRTDFESKAYHSLIQDLSEKNDLAKKHPEKLKELVSVMNNRLRSVNAQLPIVNPDYDPNAPRPEQPGPRGRGQGNRPGGGRPGGPGVAN